MMPNARPMIDVSGQGIVCASCGTNINELPFQPVAGYDVLCRDCHRTKREQPRGGGRYSDRGPRNPRPKVDVSDMGIKCAGCGTAINELPFRPNDQSRDIFCPDCFRNQRGR